VGWIVSSSPYSHSISVLIVYRYYNATTTIELTPEFVEYDSSHKACNHIMNQTYTSQFESFLAITERGPQNIGFNPVNVLLTLWRPGFNFSSLLFGLSSGPSSGPSSEPSSVSIAGAERDRFYSELESVKWIFESAP
jgi:hypothetical protein